MSYNRWLELINKNENVIIEKAFEMFEDARENPHFRFVMVMNTNGELDYWWDVAGDNSQLSFTFRGEDIEIMEVCTQYNDNLEDYDERDFIYGLINLKKEQLQNCIEMDQYEGGYYD